MQALVDDDTFVPGSYEEMVRVFGPHVKRLVLKYNLVTSNFEDLLQHTWTKLLEVDVIAKYNKSTGNQARFLTGEQVALYLKMTWNQFKVFMWRGHKGDKRPAIQNSLVQKVFERDCGICREDPAHGPDGWDAIAFARSLKKREEENPAAYKETRRALKKFGINEKTQRFWDVEVVNHDATGADKYKTVCLFCLAKKRAQSEQVRSKSSMVLTPVKGSRGSKQALYDVVDVEKIRVQREESKRCKEQPGYAPFQIPQTKSRFKLYLARAVHNIYANWCRTRSRKYKELYLGPTEEGQAWESFLEDDGRNDPEAKLIVTEEVNGNIEKVVDKLSRKVREGKVSREQIESMVSQGYTLSEIIRELNLPRTALQVVTNRFG